MHLNTQRLNAITLLVLALASAPVFGQITAFNYTGFLLDGASPANGSNDLQFALYSVASGGSPLAGSLSKTNQPVNNGVFVVSLDFGDVFDGSARWLQISARPGGSGTPFTNTFPRQAITAAPYAAFANNGTPAGGVIAFAGTNPPAGWLLCDGSAVLRTTYARLFAAVGTAWGSGDGTTTFNLPDLRGLFLRGVNGARTNFTNVGTTPVDPDVFSRTSGLTGGNSGNTVGSLQADELFSHTHLQRTDRLGYNNASGAFKYSANLSSTPFENMSGMLQNTGGNETRPKNAYVNYIIKY